MSDTNDYNNSSITLAEIGSQFHEARVHRGVLIEDVAKTLKISSKILRAIEDGNRDELPQLVFLRGFVKSYGLFLGFPDTDLQKALAYLEESEPKASFVNPTPEDKPFYASKANDPNQQAKQKMIFRGAGMIVAAMVVVVLALYLFSNNISDEMQSAQTEGEEIIVSEGSIVEVEIAVDDENLEEIVVKDNDSEEIAENTSEVDAGKSEVELIEEPTDETLVAEAENVTTIEAFTPETRAESEIDEEFLETPVRFQRIGFFGGGSETLVVQAIEDCWMTFTIDPSLLALGESGRREAYLQSGQEMLLSFEKDLELFVGNAGGVVLIKNGRNIGSPGLAGQVRTLTFTAE